MYFISTVHLYRQNVPKDITLPSNYCPLLRLIFHKDITLARCILTNIVSPFLDSLILLLINAGSFRICFPLSESISTLDEYFLPYWINCPLGETLVFSLNKHTQQHQGNNHGFPLVLVRVCLFGGYCRQTHQWNGGFFLFRD